MRIHHLLLVSLLTGAAALKGETALRSGAFVRGLEEGTGNGEVEADGLPKANDEEAEGTGLPPLKGAEKAGTGETVLPESEGEDGKDGKKDSKKMKKEKSTKAKKDDKKSKSKCKSAKAAKAKPADYVVERAGEETVPYCLHSQRSPEECAALKGGEVPEDHPKVEGDLNMEIVYDDDTSPDTVLREVEDILRKDTPPKFVGCANRRRLGEEDETSDTDSDEEDVSVTGVDFVRLMVSDEGCSPEIPHGGGSSIKCDKIETDVDVFYTGRDKVSKEEKQEMFALLVETIQAQAATGSFDSAGRVESVGSDSAGSNNAGKKIGIPIGVVFGALAVIAAVLGVMYYKRKTAAGGGLRKANSDTSDSSNEGVVHARAVIVEDQAAQARSVLSDAAEKGRKREDAVEAQAVVVNEPKGKKFWQRD